MRVFTIYDSLAEKAGPLFEAESDLVAIREYRNVMRQVSVHNRSDYRLIEVGFFDRNADPDSAAVLSGYDKPEVVFVSEVSE